MSYLIGILANFFQKSLEKSKLTTRTKPKNIHAQIGGATLSKQLSGPLINPYHPAIDAKLPCKLGCEKSGTCTRSKKVKK